MNSQDDKDKELRRRERELEARERAIRLREIESEINQPLVPLHQTVKPQESEGSLKQWSGKLVTLGKYLAIVVAVVFSIRLVTWLASVIIIGAVAWVGYKLVFERDRDRR
jgi:Flp pilus assembly protein TadB